MNDIQLACYTGPWGPEGLVEAITAISECGYDGIECPARVVHSFEDRLHVFDEILESANLSLCGLLQPVNLLDRERADETVERAANAARFLNAAGRGVLTVFSSVLREEEMSDAEWATAAAIVEEIGSRCAEFEIRCCFLPRAMRLVGTEKEIKRFMAMTNPDLVQLALDTAEMSLGGVTPKRVLRAHFDRLAGIRFRDVSGSKRRAKATQDRPGSAPQFGRGAVSFEKVSEALLSLGYAGWIVLDVTGEAHTPMDAAAGGFRYLLRKSGLFEV